MNILRQRSNLSAPNMSNALQIRFVEALSSFPLKSQRPSVWWLYYTSNVHVKFLANEAGIFTQPLPNMSNALQIGKHVMSAAPIRLQLPLAHIIQKLAFKCVCLSGGFHSWLKHRAQPLQCQGGTWFSQSAFSSICVTYFISQKWIILNQGSIDILPFKFQAMRFPFYNTN